MARRGRAPFDDQRTPPEWRVAFLDAPRRVHRHADGVEEWMTFFHDNQARPPARMAQVPAAPA